MQALKEHVRLLCPHMEGALQYLGGKETKVM
jgi:hypothetical protein